MSVWNVMSGSAVLESLQLLARAVARLGGSQLVVCFALWLCGAPACSPGTDPSSPAERPLPVAPEFTLERLDGSGSVSLDDLRGKNVVLDFWATWCVPCVRQVPAINAFYEDFGSDPDVAVFGVSTDLDGPERVADWVRSKGVKYPILVGGEALVQDFGAAGLPVTYFLDRQGRIQERHLGVIEASKLERILLELREESP